MLGRHPYIVGSRSRLARRWYGPLHPEWPVLGRCPLHRGVKVKAGTGMARALTSWVTRTWPMSLTSWGQGQGWHDVDGTGPYILSDPYLADVPYILSEVRSGEVKLRCRRPPRLGQVRLKVDGTGMARALTSWARLGQVRLNYAVAVHRG